MMKMYKMTFGITLMAGTLISISAYSWMGMWMGLEINLLSIIPLMNSSKNIYSSESSLKYFITQALASMILLFSIILIMSTDLIMINSMKQTSLLMMNTSLLTKMGAAPFHFWFPEIIEGLSWSNCLIILTWQKIAPMVILMYNTKSTTLLLMSIISSMMIGGIMGINQISMRKIMAYSSINHMGWMLAALSQKESIWMIYFLIYSFISLNMILFFKTYGIFYISQLFSILKNNLLKMTMMLNFMSLGGLPPFLGFFPKWLTINFLLPNNLALAMIMVISTLITLYYYMRICIPSMMMESSENKPFKNLKVNSFLTWWMNFLNIFSLMLCTLVFNFL